MFNSMVNLVHFMSTTYFFVANYHLTLSPCMVPNFRKMVMSKLNFIFFYICLHFGGENNSDVLS